MEKDRQKKETDRKFNQIRESLLSEEGSERLARIDGIDGSTGDFIDNLRYIMDGQGESFEAVETAAMSSATDIYGGMISAIELERPQEDYQDLTAEEVTILANRLARTAASLVCTYGRKIEKELGPGVAGLSDADDDEVIYSMIGYMIGRVNETDGHSPDSYMEQLSEEIDEFLADWLIGTYERAVEDAVPNENDLERDRLFEKRQKIKGIALEIGKVALSAVPGIAIAIYSSRRSK